MSSAPSSNNTASLLSKLNNKFKSANANQGQGALGKWPNEPNSSEVNVVITGVVIKRDGQMQYGKDRKNKKSVAALEFQPLYRWDEDPSGSPLVFKGENIRVPYEPEKLPENDKDGKQQTRAEIALDHLKGQLTGLIGSEPDDIDGALTFVEQMFADSSKSVAARVKLDIEVTPAQGQFRARTNKTDYIQEVISA